MQQVHVRVTLCSSSPVSAILSSLSVKWGEMFGHFSRAAGCLLIPFAFRDEDNFVLRAVWEPVKQSWVQVTPTQTALTREFK